MAMSTKVLLMGIEDCSFTPEGGLSVDILGIQRLEISLDGTSIAAEGDDTTLAYLSFTKGASITFDEAGLSLDALKALTGGTLTQDLESVTLAIKGGVAPNGTLKGVGKIVKTLAGETGDKPSQVEFEIPNFYVLANQLKVSMAFEQIAVVSGGGYAVPDSNGVIVKITFKP